MFSGEVLIKKFIIVIVFNKMIIISMSMFIVREIAQLLLLIINFFEHRVATIYYGTTRYVISSERLPALRASMATVRDDASEQQCLRIGDTILLYLRDRCGYVYSELSGLVACVNCFSAIHTFSNIRSSKHNRVTVFPVLGEQQKSAFERRDSCACAAEGDPGFPNIGCKL